MFWEGMNPLELGDIPLLQEAVAVVGYPQGINEITITTLFILYQIQLIEQWTEKMKLNETQNSFQCLEPYPIRT